MFDLRTITIISGGQTGADRAALDFAIQHGIDYRGWYPRNRRAEDGPIPPHYKLSETPSRSYAQRTKWNVRDSDATVIFTVAPQMRGGTALTRLLAERFGKPWLHLIGDKLAPANIEEAAARLSAFLAQHEPGCVNIAGPRASQEPAVADFVGQVLAKVWVAETASNL